MSSVSPRTEAPSRRAQAESLSFTILTTAVAACALIDVRSIESVDELQSFAELDLPANLSEILVETYEVREIEEARRFVEAIRPDQRRSFYADALRILQRRDLCKHWPSAPWARRVA